MKLEHGSLETLKRSIVEIIGKHLPLDHYKVFFFGSRVAGENSERSDIDIGVEGNSKVPVEKKFAIVDELENLPTLYKIDFVDFKDVSEKFRKEASKTREFLN